MNTNTSQTTGRHRQRATDGFLPVRRDYRYSSRGDFWQRNTLRHQIHSSEQGIASRGTSNEKPPVPITKITKLDTAETSGSVHAVQPEPANFAFPAYAPPSHPLKIVRKRHPWRRAILKGTAAFAAVVVLFGGVLFWRVYANVHKVFRGDGTVAALSTERVAPELLKGEGDGRVNILLLGIGGKGHDGGDLTDTIMVLSVDPVNNKAALLSIPRDMWVKMPVNYFGPYQKINAAYSSGKYKYLGKTDLASTNQQAVEAGFDSVNQAVSDVLGIRINYNMLVNFAAFEQAVNTVNGVVVDVKEQLYDPTMAWENGNNPVLAPVGVQAMTGKQALMYARSRETSSDFARGERQRQLLVALKQKVLSLGTLSNPGRINNLMGAFGNNIRTDLSTKAAARLYDIMKSIPDSEIASLSLTTPTSLVTTDRVGNLSVVRPRAGFNTYSDIQTYVRSQLPDGYILKERAPIYIVAATPILRDNMVASLKSYGYTITGSVSNSALPSGMNIVDITNGAKPYTLHYLQDRYGTAATSKLPEGISVPADTQFVILAGT